MHRWMRSGRPRRPRRAAAEPVRLETGDARPGSADPVLADSRLSALLFGLGAVLLAFAAMAGIATWPGAELASLTAGGPI